jgi:hypothetical protein
MTYLQDFIADVDTQLDAGGLFSAYLELISIGPITFHLSPSPLTMLELVPLCLSALVAGFVDATVGCGVGADRGFLFWEKSDPGQLGKMLVLRPERRTESTSGRINQTVGVR